MLRQLAFLLIAAPLAFLAVVVLLLNFGTMPRSDLTLALAAAIISAMVAVPAGITIWVFAMLKAEQRRGRRERL